MTDTNETCAPIQVHEKQSWHLSKELPITLIATIIVQTVSVIWFFADLRKDVELLKADNLVLHQRYVSTREDMAAALAQIQNQFERLDGKLDRLIERKYEAKP